MFTPNQTLFKLLTVDNPVLTFDEYIARRVLNRLNEIYRIDYTGVSVEQYSDLGFPTIKVFSFYEDDKKVSRMLIKYNISNESIWYNDKEEEYMYKLKEYEQTANNYYLEVPLTLEPDNLVIGDLNRRTMI